MRNFCLFSYSLSRIRRVLPGIFLGYALQLNAFATVLPKVAPIPDVVRSTHFTVSIDGASTPVLRAVSGYYLLNFEISAPVRITVTSDDPHYWDTGVEVQPMRLGIRPHREGASITFTLDGPSKISITRPGDFFADSEMLFLFANKPDNGGITAQTPGIRYYGPGIHRENIDAKSGDRIYIADGAVVFGALNLWQVKDVRVSGRGTIIYDGPQNPNEDEGWMHKPNWHVIGMDNAHDITVEGITAIVRSRTWMVQMRDSRGIVFRNVKVIGGSIANANQDGMDWLGGGDTLVQDSFFRASDDIFAMYGNWDGYRPEEMKIPGHEVSNITIENSVLSTSISNVVRIGWPAKIFDSHGFTLRNSDVIQMGVGGCGVPFSVFEMWVDPDGHGKHDGIRLENLRLDNWYSLVQLRQPNPAIEDVAFKNIWAMDGVGMVPSVLKGDVKGVIFNGVNLGGSDVGKNSDLPIEVMDGAKQPSYERGTVDANFTYSTGMISPGSSVVFSATKQAGVRYHWLFGDGESADGSMVHHAFADTQGTLLDGMGRFRVLLHASNTTGGEAWTSQSVVVASRLLPADNSHIFASGLQEIDASHKSYQGFLNVPADGGYTVSLLTSTTSSLLIDGVRTSSAKLRPMVCGSVGNAVQALRLSVPLARGRHKILIERGAEIENAATMSDHPLLYWEGPGITLAPVPDSALSHIRNEDGIQSSMK
jgi:hypothetical protein